ncbi:hypothetical protein ABZY81_39795 [Streptomyces sp. NPDC006514]|uniref:hypothetical protein n=1 Tax=Streptomyces sp. NPDC006514 TaxID=3154308 RepID=UPI0033B6BAFE
MTSGDHQPNPVAPTGLPDPEFVLRDTDWASEEMYTSRGYAEGVPALLRALLDLDYEVKDRALGDLEPIRHQSTVYPPAVPAARYIAAILSDPRTAVVGTSGLAWGWLRKERPRSFRAELLEWLGSLADDCDDKNRSYSPRPHPYMDEVRALRPEFFDAVAPFLHDDDIEVRHAALIAAVPLAEALELAHHRAELAACALRLLNDPVTDQYHRARALAGLAAWGHEVQEWQTSADIEAIAELERYADEPPF